MLTEIDAGGGGGWVAVPFPPQLVKTGNNATTNNPETSR